MVLYGCQFEKKKSSSWNIWKNPWSYIYECLVKYHIDFVTFFAPKKDLIFCNFLKICVHNTEFRKIIPWCCTDKKMVLYGHQRNFYNSAHLLHQMAFHLAVKSKIKVSRTLLLFSIYPLLFKLWPFLIFVSKNRLSFFNQKFLEQFL